SSSSGSDDKYYPDKALLCDNRTSAWVNYDSSPSPSPSASASPSPSPSSTDSVTVGAVNTDMLGKLLTEDWIPIDSSNPEMGDYRLRDYTIDGDKAILIVEARAENEGGDSNNLGQNNSTRAVQVTVPFSTDDSSGGAGEGTETSNEELKLPGLWISDTSGGSGGNGDNSKQSSNNYKSINAVAWVDCSQDNGWRTNSSYVNDGKIDDTPVNIGSTTITPNTRVVKVKDDLPDIPSMPSTGVYQFNNLVKINNCYVTLPRITANQGEDTCNSEAQIDNNVTTDTDINGIYYYYFKNSGDSLLVENGQLRIKPPAGKKVVIYVKGLVSVTGTGNNHGERAYCDETGASGTVPVDSYIGDPNDPSKLEMYSNYSSDAFKLQGQNIISAFVHAPNGKVLISQSEIRGAVWAEEFDASNSGGADNGCGYSVKQENIGEISWIGQADNTPAGDKIMIVPQMGSVNSWQPVEKADSIVPQAAPSESDFEDVVSDGSIPSPSPSASPSPSPSASSSPEEEKCTVPSIIGMNTRNSNKLAKVTKKITDAGLQESKSKVSSSGSKNVKTQSPAGGTEVDCGSTVTYTYKQ
ncbi:MAG: PASTA domain-containing protein, partial [Xenococcus sp. (in: cyanobacteria)]